MAGDHNQFILKSRREAPRSDGDAPASDEPAASPEALLARLAKRLDSARYVERGAISKGGQGEVCRVWDAELRRSLAMKSMLRRGVGEPKPRDVERFLEEAQVTGQLDHPGVVPVHELGLHQDGGLFFTMRLVRGRTLGEIFEEVEAGSNEWTLTRALGVVLRVCETMAFAHERGVIHRDLKPANVMVGRFGEVYVMDWGLAHVLGTEDRRDIRLAGEPTTMVWTDRREAARHRPDSPLVTMDGDVVGTPAYMSPEQAEGHIEGLGPASDVYSAGAMLYQLLGGAMPYADSTMPAPPSPHVVWHRVLAGPPLPLEGLRYGIAPELVAITERAMARDPQQRYPSMQEMADELRFFLEGRVVPTHRTGPLIELQKWVRRNRAFAASLAALVVVAIGAAVLYGWNESRRVAEIERYARVAQAEGLLAEVPSLGAVEPAAVARRDAWLRRADELLAGLPAYRAELVRLRDAARAPAAAPPAPDDASDPVRAAITRWQTYVDEAEGSIAKLRDPSDTSLDTSMSPEEDARVMERGVAWARAEIERLQAVLARRWVPGARDAEGLGKEDEHARLVAALEELGVARAGVAADREQAASLAATSVERYADRWADARREIRLHPLYEGLDLAPQLGLVPLGPDPTSSLWEFWHVLSGVQPQRDEDGELVMAEETGVVLVLIPGGTTTIGAQNRSVDEPNYDAEAEPIEMPPTELTLDPYFLSKFEMTQGQWLHLTGELPSEYFAGSRWRHYGAVTLQHPVERVSWYRSMEVLAKFGLALPTEAQWEYAARAYADTPFCFGRDFADHGINYLDRSALAFASPMSAPPAFDDGFLIHAPVRVGEPNAFGLFAVQGNMWEWCKDLVMPYDQAILAPGTGESLRSDYDDRVLRGGSFLNQPRDLRLSRRRALKPTTADTSLGLRPSRRVLP